jgi:NhaP-type Na+/H+ and K+/H+ antiporter
MDPVLKVALAIVIFFSGLIGIVVVVGLLRQQLSPSGIATMLGGVVTSIMGGVFVRWKNIESSKKPSESIEDE